MAEQHAGGWRSPVVLAGIGVVLMVAGWKASTYTPGTTPEDAENERRLADLRARAEEFDRVSVQPGQEKLSDKVAHYAPPRLSPYETPGRLAVYAGLVLFVAAAVLMYRRPAPEPDPEAEGPPDGPAAG